MTIKDDKFKEYKFPSDKMVCTRELTPLFTCKICNKLIKECTTIGDCLHSFCKKCIYKKVFEEKSRKCPVCNVEFTDPPAKVLRPDAMMRSLKVRLFGSHKRTPEQRAESKRIRFENMQASEDQAKKPESTKKPMIICKNKTKEKVIVKPLEDEGTSCRSTKKPPITYKDNGKAIVTHKSSEDRHILPESTKMPVIICKNKTKEKVIFKPLEDEGTLSQSTKKPPITYKDKGKAIVTVKSSEDRRILKGKGKKKVMSWGDNSESEKEEESFQAIHMDNENTAVTATTASGSKSEEPKRRVRQKCDATPSDGTRISPQDVIDAGKYINPAKKTRYTWFILTPSEEQNRKEPLRPLPGPNVNVKGCSGETLKKLRNAWEPSIWMGKVQMRSGRYLRNKEVILAFHPVNILGFECEALDNSRMDIQKIKGFDWKIHPTVSTLMKYIAVQLKLDNGEKVGIFMYGSLLSPEMKLADVVNQWVEIVGSERETTNIGASAHFFCVKLTYA